MRRLTLTGGQVFLAPGTTSQILLNMMICIGSMRVYAEYTPFKTSANNLLAETAQWQLLATMLAALAIKAGAVDDDEYNMTAFDFFLALLQFIAPTLLVFQLGTQAKAMVEVRSTTNTLRRIVLTRYSRAMPSSWRTTAATSQC